MVVSGQVEVKARVAAGLKVAGGFFELDWVKQQISGKLGFVPFPGTLNLVLSPTEGPKLQRLIMENAPIALEPPINSGFCRAVCYPVSLENSEESAVILPLVDNYPATKLEIMAPFHIKSKLKLHEGDLVTFSFTFN